MDGSLYQFHGLTVDCIDKTDPNSEERRAAYGCDITFGTNNEFGFDYLRMTTWPHRRRISYSARSTIMPLSMRSTPCLSTTHVRRSSSPVRFRRGMIRCSTSSSPMWRRWSTPSANSPSSFCSKPRRKSPPEIQKDGGLSLFRAYKGAPQHTPLIRYLSEDGIKQLMLKVEAKYMADNNREIPKAVEPLFFVIDEKNHSIELTDKGVSRCSLALLPTLISLSSPISRRSSVPWRTRTSPPRKSEKKDSLLQNYSVKAERVHTVNQLLKAYTLFDKDVEYVIDDNKIKIVDEQTGRIMEGPSLFRRSAPGHRGQGRREGRGCHTDLRHHHAPELFPHVPEACRYDRYRHDRGRRVLRYL